MRSSVARAAIAVASAVSCAVMLAARPQQAPPQDPVRPVFSARSDVVRLDIFVSAADRPVLGLKAEDFRILDNGVPQQPDFVSFDQLPLNVVFVFDVSGSIVGDGKTVAVQ